MSSARSLALGALIATSAPLAAALPPVPQQCTVQTKVTASDAAAGDGFGIRLGISGTTAVVTAPFHDGPGLDSGAVYVFERGSTGWGEVTKLEARDAELHDGFGVGVGVDGDTIAVGSLDDTGQNRGVIYVFDRNEGGENAWGGVAKLTIPGPEGVAFTIALDGDTIAGVSSALSQDTTIHVFERGAGGPDDWDYVRAVPSDLDITAISIAGDRMAVLARELSLDGGPLLDFEVRVYERDLGGPDAWGLAQVINPSDEARGQYLTAMALSGDVLVIGSTNDEDNGETGSAYVFEYSASGVWVERAKLFPSDPAPNVDFGAYVSVARDRVVVGAPAADLVGLNTGAAYLFARDAGGPGAWGQVDRIVPDGLRPWDLFGYAVRLSDNAIVGSVTGNDTSGVGGAAVYFFDPCLIATSFCASTANSTGSAASISAGGTSIVAQNDLMLRAEPVPANVNGLFFYGPVTQEVPFGEGFLCVGAGGVGLARLAPTVSTSAGALVAGVDTSSPPTAATQISPGTTWFFQGVFRDPAGGGALLNLSDGLSVTFHP